MRTVDVPVTGAVLGHATHVSARAEGAIASGDAWLRTSDGAPTQAPRASTPLTTVRQDPPREDGPRFGRRVKGTVARITDADPALLVETQSRRERRAYWICGDKAWPALDPVGPLVRVEVIAPEAAIAVDPAGTARVLFADGSDEAVIALPRWLSGALRWHADAPRYLWGLPEDGIVVMTVATGLAWLPIRALLAAAGADRVRWIPRETIAAGTRAETTGEVLFASANMTLVASGTDRILVKVATGCAKGDRVRLLGRSVASGPPEYALLVRPDGVRIPCGGEPPAAPEETAVTRAPPSHV